MSSINPLNFINKTAYDLSMSSIIQKGDKDNDGKISRSEFYSLIDNYGKGCILKLAKHRAFKSLDKNKDGHINLDSEVFTNKKVMQFLNKNNLSISKALSMSIKSICDLYNN